jgi:hypothetical protein
MRIRVLWVDDQYEAQQSFIAEAEQEEIDITPLEYAKDGIAELNEKHHYYDAVILDAKGLNERADKTLGLTGLKNIRDRLIEINTEHYLPFFIFTGQPGYLDNSDFKESYGEYYIKVRDNEALFRAIKEKIKNKVEYLLRKEHEDIFELFEKNLLSQEVGTQLIELLKTPPPKTNNERKGILTNIRSIQESCLLKLTEVGIIPSSITNVGEKLKYLSGNKSKETDYKPATKEYQNDSIDTLQKWVYFTCGKYIHNLDDNQYNGYRLSKYGIESLKNGVLELLIWFKKVCTENMESKF